MAVSSTTTRTSYAGDGSTNPLPIPWIFWSPTDITVYSVSATGAATLWTLGSQYTITGGAGSTGNVVPTSGTTVGTSTLILLKPVETHLTSYVPNEPFPSEVIQEDFDRLTQMVQYLNALSSYALSVPYTESSAPTGLPAAATRANNFLAFDGSGNPQMSPGVSGVALTQGNVGLALYPQTAAEVSAGVTPTNYGYRTEPYDLRRYGVASDSNGTTGNGTDNTAALRNAIKVAKQKGSILTAPPGICRFTAPITEFTDLSLSTMASLHGDSKYSTIFFADFTSASRVAAFSCDNTSGNRMYWSFKNFRMIGVNDTRVVGLYSNYGGFLSEFENLGFWPSLYDGLIVANNFEVKLTCIDALCANNGIQIGYCLDNTTLGKCNNVTFYGGDTTLCGASGVYAKGAENISFHGHSSEGNKFTNYYMDTCEGVVFSGCYMETDPATTGSQTAQMYCLSCNSVVINGITITAFKHGGEPIFYMESCAGVTINGVIPRTTGGPFNAIGLKLKSSTGVSINGSTLSDCSTSIYLDSTSASELSINTTKFANYTTTVNGVGAVAHKVQWNQAVAADVTASAFNTANSVDLSYTNNAKNQVENTEVFQLSCSVAQLNAGGVDIIAPVLSMERWRIVDIIVYNDTAFDAGGDRTVRILDNTAVIAYATITAANLKAASAVNRWGSAVVPFPVTADQYTPSSAGNKVRVMYNGGTTNYATGNLQITVTAMRTQ
jgi:hypothetical protein